MSPERASTHYNNPFGKEAILTKKRDSRPRWFVAIAAGGGTMGEKWDGALLVTEFGWLGWSAATPQCRRAPVDTSHLE